MIVLAPMEGIVDVYMRDILTQVGGFDLCVTEFVRVHQALYPASVYLRFCPELHHDGKTNTGIPVFVQLMGNDEQVLAENAAFVSKELGAPGIDLNFGCPAKIVNRRCAGSALLAWPERICELVTAVRKAVPASIPVTAKMRLGYETADLAIENALAIQEGGAKWVTVHARTKVEGYKPPVHWDKLALIREAVDIPVIANGDIWTVEDYHKCIEVSGCDDVMLGRGAIAMPDLARQIKASQTGAPITVNDWKAMLVLLKAFFAMVHEGMPTEKAEGRIKQWIKLVRRTYPEAADLFHRIKREKDLAVLQSAIQQATTLAEQTSQVDVDAICV
jgi:tRNA-dihydrouridine synthase C